MSQNFQRNHQGNQPAPEKARELEIEKVPFTGTTISKVTTTMDLSAVVNSIFKDVFADFEGSILFPNPYNGSLELSLFFKDKLRAEEGQIKNIIDNTSIRREDRAIDRIRSLNIRNSNKIYSLTDETKSILQKFMNTNRHNPNVNWGAAITEEVEPTYNGGHQVYVRVSGLDINKILKAVYGNKSANGSYIDYEIRLIRPLSMTEGNGNFLINLTQLDVKDVENLCKKIGMLPAHGTIQMVKA